MWRLQVPWTLVSLSEVGGATLVTSRNPPILISNQNLKQYLKKNMQGHQTLLGFYCKGKVSLEQPYSWEYSNYAKVASAKCLIYLKWVEKKRREVCKEEQNS